ncbi:hypothetical protein [Pontibacter chitinilyticus]|uniref:hypothetical protein n=1 Tax=Pontibacter chitinilyticus TaxID=2674989 RepID=UPI00321B0244
MRIRSFALLLLSLLLSHFAEAQLNNQALLQTMPVVPQNANQLRFSMYSFGFCKNNEYFNKIADGYTLFGYQLNPRLTYYPSANVRIDAGVFLWKDFGSGGYQDIVPTFTIKVQRANWALLFGTLEGNLNHGYIEPLYNFERVINSRLENGAQYQLHTPGINLDAWIDWANMLYVGEDDQEQIHAGATAAITLLRQEAKHTAGDSLLLTLPVQLTAQHKGGQIDASDLPLVTLLDVAAGLDLEKTYADAALQRVYTKNYWVGYKDLSNEYLRRFTQGHGLYLNAGVDTKYSDVMLSYWHGRGYISELGGKLYQSVSTTYKNPGYVDEDRRLLILRLMKDFELLDNLYLTLRLEPVMDLDEQQIEFSNALYLTFDTDFFVAKPKH